MDTRKSFGQFERFAVRCAAAVDADVGFIREVGRFDNERVALPMSASSAEVLVNSLLGDDPSVEANCPLLVEATEGRPLFAMETVRALVDEGQLEGAAGEYRLTNPKQIFS